MGSYLIAVDTVVPLFLVIFAGFLFSLTRVASRLWIEILNQYALWIGFPALVVHSLMRLEGIDGPVVTLTGLNSLYIIACIFLAYPVSAILRFSSLRRRTLFLVFAFGNVAYLGIPFLQYTLGEEILPVAAILSAVYVFWLLTLALVMVETGREDRPGPARIALRLIRNPLLISVFAGLALVLLPIRLPAFAGKTLSMFSGSVTAVVLFSLGIFMGFQQRGSVKDWFIAGFMVILTMMVFPAIFRILLIHTNLPVGYVQASVLDAAMPLGLTPYALAQQYHLDTSFAARIVVLSTFLSILILPLWLVVLTG